MLAEMISRLDTEEAKITKDKTTKTPEVKQDGKGLTEAGKDQTVGQFRAG